MIVLTLIALIAVMLIAGFHLAWAAKLWWPASDERQLVRSVAGFPDVDKMPPPASCLVVAVALCCVSLLLLVEIFQPAPHAVASGALFCAGLVFIGRGAIGFTPWWSRITPEQPFRQLDIKYYSPLCLALGAIIVATSVL